jgi:hypothetical protein
MMFYNDGHNNGYNNDHKVHIETVGETRMKMMDSSGRTNETNANWDLAYNNDAYGRGGLEGDVETMENGKRNKYRLQMDNEDLAQIFSAPHRRGSLNKRLINDFQMSHRRPFSQGPLTTAPLMKMMIIDDRPPIMDESLMQIMRAMQRPNIPQRSRRMRIDYSSGPKDRRRHPLIKKTRRRRRRSRSRGIKRPSSSKRYSLRSNIPLTEIND